MAQIEVLNKQQHKHLKIDTTVARRQAAGTRMMPVMLSEFQKLAIEYPILLTKNGDTGAFLTVALFGFEDGENLFWQDGHWDAIYQPLNLRRLPLMIGKNEHKEHKNDHDYLVCLDPENPSISTAEGEPLFDDMGAPTPFLQGMQSVLANLIKGEEQTNIFVETLLEMNLVTPVSLDITLADQEKIRAEGLYGIDEDRVNSLTPEQLANLQQKGYLAAIYAMIVSVGQVYRLIQMKNHQRSRPSPWLQSAS